MMIATKTVAVDQPSLVFDSGTKQVSLVELYTSEGCSSCPPADAWLGKLAEHPDLWTRFVPIAFHVDYWNYLGWKDPWSKSHHSKRQRRYRSEGGVKSVYTPGFVVNGEEWRGWFSRKRLPDGANQEAGALRVTVSDDALEAIYAREHSQGRKLDLNVALLGFDLISNIRSGENRGKELEHQFVVLDHAKYRAKDGQWNVPMPQIKESSDRYGLAVWVTKPSKQKPLQAVGGWLH